MRPGINSAGYGGDVLMEDPLQPPNRKQQNLTEHWRSLRDHVRELSDRFDRENPPALVAVTKGFPAALCRSACTDGNFSSLGENRVNEALQKNQELNDLDIRWHMVGHLQSNKVRKITGVFSLIHSVDRPSLLNAFEKRLADTDPVQAVLLQVNVSGEESKHGAEPDAARGLVDRILETECLDLRGLMTMAPWTDDRRVLNETFEQCRKLRDELEEQTGHPLPELSMGMSNDYPQAIRHGATMLRLGRVLFGERPVD